MLTSGLRTIFSGLQHTSQTSSVINSSSTCSNGTAATTTTTTTTEKYRLMLATGVAEWIFISLHPIGLNYTLLLRD